MENKFSGNEIRKTFIEFFKDRGHTVVTSSSLVPGGDATLLFTNAGMVQFKEVFLGTDSRPYKRAVNSQKCMRVAGKHNDLDDVGRDDWHHTFFEMLGNWSFGDYYKKEAIGWAWELLTTVWGLDRSKLWVTVFKDEKGEIPTDTEAAKFWALQPGMNPEQILFFGRKDNFWEMAETGPCGPCSEIHIDRGEAFCEKKGVAGHVCKVNGDCNRFLELWNNVFIQYNRINETELEPLPATHVDTGMGFERIVSVLQDVDSNYKIDLLANLIKKVQHLTGMRDEEVFQNYTPYRVIADHARAATFLIADGVVPGNTGRNYICRMIIRRAARFGGKIGLNKPFLAEVAKEVIDNYGEAYPELVRNQETILSNLTREEERFQKTLEAGLSNLEEIFENLKKKNEKIVSGNDAFELYATHGLPLEITRDIAREQGYDVDETGFKNAMEQHRLDSGAGKTFGVMGNDDVDNYRNVFDRLVNSNKISKDGVLYDPYHDLVFETEIIALFKDGQSITEALPGDLIEILLPKTGFYVESGGQVADTGLIHSLENEFEIEVAGMRRPAAGMIVHVGKVLNGKVQVGKKILAMVDGQRRMDIMRNHTATHLLHAELHRVLGKHARQAGSLVAPDKLRFDFTHPEGLTQKQLEEIEKGVNKAILENHHLQITHKSLNEAISEGAMALFGEKYGEVVRTITIGNHGTFSYELCGGTHVDDTGDIGTFIITSEGSTAAGIRRIEAVTGRAAYDLILRQTSILKTVAGKLSASIETVTEKIDNLQYEFENLRKENTRLKQLIAKDFFLTNLMKVKEIDGVPVHGLILPGADNEALRSMTDLFKDKYPTGVVVVSSIIDDKPMLVASVTEDLVARGIHAGQLIKYLAGFVGGGGGGKPTLAQAGGKDGEKLPVAMSKLYDYVREHLK
ncbi:MAG: alanine--tRNA ligase [Anaerolineaceae bacterium]|nr:alanine--tRNA ligase [Anaerolineaceae bacterium]